VLFSLSKSVWAGKLCSNKTLQCFLGYQLTHVNMYNDYKPIVVDAVTTADLTFLWVYFTVYRRRWSWSWRQDLCIAPFRENSPLKRSEWHVLRRDHSFTCHPHVYPQMEWAILPLLPSRSASPYFGRYSLSVPQRVGGWVGLDGWLGYLQRWYGRPKTINHPSTNRPIVRRD